MRTGLWKWLAVTVLLLVGGQAAAQGSQPAAPAACDSTWLTAADLSGSSGDFIRVARLAGHAPASSRLLRRHSRESRTAVCATRDLPWSRRTDGAQPARGPATAAAPVALRSEFNSAYARDRNNGALWAGRGLSTAVTAGVHLRVGSVTAAVRPILIHQQNRAFEVPELAVPGYSSRIYYGHPARIDWPQRMGEGAFWTVDPGPSYLQLEARGLAAGISTENLWWGPAGRNPLLLSNTAPGFPHVFLGTSSPLDLRVGHLEGEVVWGRLGESAWFDADAANDHRLFGGLIATFQPALVPGLWIGAARAVVTAMHPEESGLGTYASAPFEAMGDAEGALALTSLFARWILAESGFEIYGEVVPGDYHWDAGEAGREAVDRNPAYVVGLGKVVPWGDRWLHVYGEVLQLQNRISLRNNLPTATYYVDSGVPQGYTHRGQLLGAASGPGSEAQLLGADVYASWGSAGLFVERVVFDDDAYFEQHAYNFGFHGHDVEVSMRLRQTLLLGSLELSWSAGPAYRWNRHFLGLGPYRPGFEPRTDTNWSGSLEMSWAP